MNARAGFLIVLLGAIFSAGLIRVFSIHFATGEVYPDYSSMKASPEGAKLLYDALSRTPGLTVTRNYFPLDFLDETNATMVFLALDPPEFSAQLERYEKLANRGNRLVAALEWREKKPPEHLEGFDKVWQVKTGFEGSLYFAEAPGWRVLDRDGSKLLAIERDFGKGSLALYARSGAFENQSTVRLERLAMVSAALGANSRIIFDEQHFGIAESGTVVGLARRFRLGGMALGLALCAALFIWKNSAAFPPASAAPPSETLSGRTSISGLVTLLRRHIKPADLAATCWNEWLTSHRNDLAPARKGRAEAILRERAGEPLEAVREIQTALHSTVFDSKGPL